MNEQDPAGTTSPFDGPSPEPAPAPASVETVVVPVSRPSRARWVVALVVVALVATASVAAAMLLTGRAPDSVVLGWTPRDSVTYMEVRLDLPGDQRGHVGAFLSKFPGFADQAAVESKVAEVLDRIVSSASSGDKTYTRDVAPWFDGQIAVSASAFPDPSFGLGGLGAAATPRVLVLVTIKDAVAARTWFTAQMKDVTTRTESYGSTDLTIVAQGDTEFAFAIAADRVALVGDIASVKAALDTGGSAGLGAEAGLRAALAAAGNDHVGFMYVHLRAYLEWARDLAESMPGMGSPFELSDTLVALYPDWVGMRARVEPDGLVFDVVTPHVDSPALRANAPTALADRIPAAAVVVVEGHAVGQSIKEAIDLYRDMPGTAEVFTEFDQAAGILGGVDGLLGWIGDGALVVDRTAGGVDGGLLIAPTDPAAASRLMTTLRSFVSFGGASMGITIRDESHGSAIITTIDVTEAVGTVGGFDPGMEMPFAGPYRLAYTVTDDLVVIGATPEFVGRVLDTSAGTSLSSSARFTELMDRIGRPNVGITFVDLTAIRELVEGALPGDPEMLAMYERDIKPFMLPFDALAQATVVGGDIDRSTFVITVK
jgi:hypothetical protein